MIRLYGNVSTTTQRTVSAGISLQVSKSSPSAYAVYQLPSRPASGTVLGITIADIGVHVEEYTIDNGPGLAYFVHSSATGDNYKVAFKYGIDYDASNYSIRATLEYSLISGSISNVPTSVFSGVQLIVSSVSYYTSTPTLITYQNNVITIIEDEPGDLVTNNDYLFDVDAALTNANDSDTLGYVNGN